MQPHTQYAIRNRLWLDLSAALLLALLILAFFWRTLSGDVYQPADGGDLVSFLFPTYRFAAAALADGHLPLWNPTLYGGAPFIADIQAGFLYPPNLLLFLLNPDFDYPWMQWLAIGHLWWAGLGVYALGRALGMRRAAALFAGTAFALSDPLLIHLGNLNLIAVLSWLGWVLAAFHLALARRSLAWAGLAGALFALSTYAGHAQSSYYIGLAVGGYWVIGKLGDWRLGDWRLGIGDWRRLPNLQSPNLLIPLFTALLTLLLSAPLLLPSLELLPYTARAELAYQENVGYSLAPVPALVGLITPGFFGRGPALHWSFWDRVELPYAGAVTLLLALAVFFRSSNSRSSTSARSRTSPWLPWIGLALFGLLVAFGVYAPVHGWLTQLLPGFDAFRAPARAIVLWALGVAVLAGYGVDWLTADGGRRTGDDGRQTTDEANPQSPIPNTQYPIPNTQYENVLKWGGLALLLLFTPAMYASLLALQADSLWFLRASLAGLAVALATLAWLGTWALVALGSRGIVSGPAFAGLLVALLLVELAATGAYTDISEGDPARGFHNPEIVAFLREEMDDGRRTTDEPSSPLTSVVGRQSSLFRIDARTDIDDLWQPDTAALVGLRDVWGIVNPLLLSHWERLWESTGGRHTRLYDMLNAGYVLVRDGTPLPDKFILAFDATGELTVYRNPDAFPRAWLVADAQTVPDADAALAALTAPDFDPARTVVLLDGGRRTTDDGRTTTGSGPASANLPISQSPISQSPISNTPNTLHFTLTSPTPAFLVLSEVWYPGWRATVNGVQTPVLRANYALRAVEIPAGDVTVELTYAPDSWRWGLALAGLGLLLLAGLAVWRR